MDEALVIDAGEVASALRAGLRGHGLLERLAAVPARDRDVWLDAVLGVEAPEADVEDLPRGAVPYLPCSVDEIVAAVRELPLRASDMLVDIGAGLGRVVILAHLLSGARTRGIELQAPLVARARACVEAFRLVDVEMVHANVVEAPLHGNVFFLYAPCNGAMLRRVMARLEEEARHRPISLCAVGLELGELAWLVPRATSCVSLVIYDSAPRE